MKRRYIPGGIFASLLLAAAVGCSSRENPVMEFESYSFATVGRAADTPAGADSVMGLWELKGSGVLPLRSGDADISQLRDTLERVARVHFKKKGGAASPLLEKGMRDMKTLPDSASAGNESLNTLSIVLATPRVIVWEDYAYEYPYMAAHGSYTYSYINYCIPHNRIVTLDYLFKKGYQQPLLTLLRNRLKENTNLIVGLDEVKLPATYRLLTDGVEFVWGLYEIAPYSEGPVRVKLEEYEIEDLLTSDGHALFN